MVKPMAGTSKSRRFALAATAALALLASAVALLVTATPNPAGAEPRLRACPNADTPVPEASKGEMRRAVGCLIARERAKRDRRKARPNPALKRVAQKHSAKMVRSNCFEHQCPGEAPLGTRIEKSGYVGPGDRYGYGEITGCGPSPRTMVEQWMDTRVARKTLLGRRFRHVGIGVVKKAPKVAEGCETPELYATYTVLFAWRRG
jgi:uncharacterized protein YkwD